MIRSYYGDETAIYFEWMNKTNFLLSIPGTVSTFVFIGNLFYWDIETSPGSAIFSIVMSVWGSIFIVLWRRHSNGLRFLWDDNIENSTEDLRKEFEGTIKINPITD